ncbi:MAG: arylsulfatase [Planctomycetota bacterium]|jgi:arylsulfatase A-like enzyme
MKRRDFLRMAGGCGLLLSLSQRITAAESRRKPNVILILTDDQGYGDLACNGNKVIKTPNLDKLYAQSVRLENYHVSPVCTPTRAALMTGRCPNRTGIWHVVMGPSQLRKDELTAADVFSFNKYKTAIFGKWHLGDNYPFRPQDRGFQEVLVHGGGVIGHVPDHWLNNYFDDTYLHNGKKEKFKGYCTDIWFDSAITFIKHNKNNPFFVYLSLNAPHAPYLAPEENVKLYRDNPAVPHAEFYGMITRIDENIPRLTQELENMNLVDDTILIFMTDNGTARGIRGNVGHNAGMRGRKSSEYDGGHRVPCWFYWPAGSLKGGRDVKQLTDHVDILPTLIDLCGLKLPREVEFDGASIVPLLKGNDKNWPDRVMVVEEQNVTSRPVKWRKCAVMTERWRLVNGRELYDMKNDPGQKRNIAKQEPDVVKRLRSEYEKWWSSVSESHDKVTEIIVGSPHENPSRLTCYHWNSESGTQSEMPWGQAHIVAGMHVNGYWNLYVDRKGRYTIRLRRWPSESGLAINDTSDAKPPERPSYLINAKPIVATKARIRIQDVDETLPVKEDAEEIVFTVTLKAGSSRLKTWFMDDNENSRGAFYVHIQRL